MARRDDNRTKNFTFGEAVEYLVAAKIIEGSFSVGTDSKRSCIVLPAGTIDVRENGFFHRADMNRLIGFAQMDRCA